MRSVTGREYMYERVMAVADRRIVRRLVIAPSARVFKGQPIPEWPRAWML